MRLEVKRFNRAKTVPAPPKGNDKGLIAFPFLPHGFCLSQPFRRVVHANSCNGRSPKRMSRTSGSEFKSVQRCWKKRCHTLQKLTAWRGKNPFRNRLPGPARFKLLNQPLDFAGQSFQIPSRHDFNCIRGKLLSAFEPDSLGDRPSRKDAPCANQTTSPRCRRKSKGRR